LDVVAPQHQNGFGDALFFMRGDEQVDVVGHQHVGVDIVCVAQACWSFSR
jgi:hypothetical protein